MNICIMPRLTVTVSEEQDEYLKEQSNEVSEFDSKSDVMRDCINAHQEVSELRTKVKRLENEKRQLIEQHQEHGDLVRFAKDEQRWRRAPLTDRIKWLLWGMDD